MPREMLPWYERPLPVIGALLGLIFVLFLGSVFWRTVVYYQAIRHGESSTLPQFVGHFSANGLKNTTGSDVPEAFLSPRAPRMGPLDAPITIVEFGDFECPYCKEAFPTIRGLALKYPTKIRYIWRDSPLDAIHPHATPAAIAASCANMQDKFWQMHDLLFTNGGGFERSDFLRIARQIGLIENTFVTCLDAGGDKERLAADKQASTDAGVRGTPTFFINGTKVEGAIPNDIFEKIVTSLTN